MTRDATTLIRKTEYEIVLPQLDDLQELNIMLADRLKEWAQNAPIR